MHIEELHLENFRGFQELTLKFPSDVAVFIGVNGSGKSSILDSIAIILSQFVFALRKKGKKVSEFDLTEDDININSDTTNNYIRVAIDSNMNRWSISRDRKRLKSITNRKEINLYASQLLQELEDKNDLSLPILVYYKTQRIVINSSSRNSSSLKDGSENDESRQFLRNSNQLDAYRTAFSSNVNDFQDFFDWFKEEEEYENEVRLREDQSFRNPSLEIVRKAIEKFLEGFPNTQFNNLHVVRATASRELGIRRLITPILVINKNGEDLKIDQLSDGEKTVLMLVVDIARRLAILNPSITNPAELLDKGKGIILIDEVDLHLHPQWQRIVLPSFTKTFPSCQFIVTTHSPQVLSGIKRENVFILEDSAVVEVTPHTFGRDTNSIIFEVMGVEKRHIEVQENLDNCFELIDNGKLEEAKIEVKKLSELLGDNDSEIVRAYTLIDFFNRVE
ncbi:MAG: AAA family ATPase [Gloeotrichia echinulata DEX184]|nr:AAA family ATPase [Gloeotrichia echinulata DEX184]